MAIVDSHTRHLIGACYGPHAGPSACAVCGPSPFAVGRPTADVLGPGFTDYDLLADAATPTTCAGCAAMLGGKPGSVPMPLRMGHFAVVGGVLVRPSAAEVLALVYTPPPNIGAIAWTATRQRHASLRCGPCSSDHLAIGTESGTVAWDVAAGRALIDAVTVLRGAARQDHILTGQYPPHVILALGALWRPAEAVAGHYRPGPHLDIAVALARRPESTPMESPMPISDPHRRAAELVLAIGNASLERERDPIAFWATLYPRRLTAAAQRSSLMMMVEKLTQAVRCKPSALGDVVVMLDTWTPEQGEEVLRLCREAPLLIIAFSRQISRERYEEQTCTS